MGFKPKLNEIFVCYSFYVSAGIPASPFYENMILGVLYSNSVSFYILQLLIRYRNHILFIFIIKGTGNIWYHLLGSPMFTSFSKLRLT
jgi:hypothetical protein